jgi:hypothetical protein
VDPDALRARLVCAVRHCGLASFDASRRCTHEPVRKELDRPRHTRSADGAHKQARVRSNSGACAVRVRSRPEAAIRREIAPVTFTAQNPNPGREF